MTRMLLAASLASLVATSVPAAPPPPSVDGALGAKLDRYLTESKFVGVALVAKDGRVVLMKGYGDADREKKEPYATDTIVSIGSITKQFTSAAILKLEEAFNTKEIEKVRAFRATNMVKRPGGPTEEQRDQVTKRMWGDFGSLTIEGVLAEDEEGVTVRMKPASAPPVHFQFMFSPENKIEGLKIEAGD